MPVVAPMLAKLVEEIPPGLFYEPKWDGFRAIVERDGDAIEIHSRNLKPMARYFPDLVDAFAAMLPERCVVDGEIVVISDLGRLDFFNLQQRIHPAGSRVDRLASETPASFVAFDLLALGGDDLTGRGFGERRAALETLRLAPPLHLTPITTDPALAQDWFERFEGAGLDGIIAKAAETTYQPGKRAMFKVKHQRTLDAVVSGYRLHKTIRDGVGSILLGLYNDGEGAPVWAEHFGGLVPIGATSSFAAARRRELLTELEPLVIDRSEHPWRHAERGAGAGNRWDPTQDRAFFPLRIERVAEVKYDHIDGGFFRHPATFVRWRPDREPRSCTFEQLAVPAALDVRAALREAR
jgi:ATP-dependent DNA ligase